MSFESLNKTIENEKEIDKEKEKNGTSQELQSEIQLEKQKESMKNKVVQSTYLKQYLEFYREYMGLDFGQEVNDQKIKQLMNPQMSKNVLKAFSVNNIVYHFDKFCPFNILLSKATKKYRVVQLDVQIGYFTLKILILNKKQYKHTHEKNQNQLGSDSMDDIGAFGFIQHLNLHNKILKYISDCYENPPTYPDTGSIQYVTKNVKFFEDLTIKQSERNSSCLKQFILEYSLCKIASCLEVGLQVYCFSGFDLICYLDSVQFCMEKGEPVNSKIFTESCQMNSVKKQLLQLHKLRIVHNDIKTDNLMYSPSLRKVVFIDFGLSEAILQKWGEKTLTQFKGSYLYAGQQMKKIIITKQDFADLYWNDVHCLQKALRIIKNSVKPNKLSPNKKGNVSQFLQKQGYFQLQKNSLSNLQNKLSLEIIHCQLLYALYFKKIQFYKELLSSYFQILKKTSSSHQAQRKHFIRVSIMPFLLEFKECPLYDEIYMAFYKQYRKAQWQQLKNPSQKNTKVLSNTNKQQQQVFYFLYKIFHTRQNYELRKSVSNLLAPSNNLKNRNHTKLSGTWIKIMNQQLAKVVQQKLHLLNKISLNASDSDIQPSELQRQLCFSVCELLTFCLNVIYNNQDQKTEISQCLLPIFEDEIVTIIQEEYQRSHNRQSARLMMKMKADLLQKVQEITSKKRLNRKSQKNQQYFNQNDKLNQRKFRKQDAIKKQEKSFQKRQSKFLFNYDKELLLIMVKFIEKKLFQDKNMWETISNNNSKFIFVKKRQQLHFNIQGTISQQKVLMFLFVSYCDMWDMNSVLRIMQIIKNTFKSQNRQTMELFCLIHFIRRFYSDMRCSRGLFYCDRYNELFQNFFNKKQIQRQSQKRHQQLSQYKKKYHSAKKSQINNYSVSLEPSQQQLSASIDFQINKQSLKSLKQMIDFELCQNGIMKLVNHRNSKEYLQKIFKVKQKIDQLSFENRLYFTKSNLLKNMYVVFMDILNFRGQYEKCLNVYKKFLEKLTQQKMKDNVDYLIMNICHYHLGIENNVNRVRGIYYPNKQYFIQYHGFSWYQTFQKEIECQNIILQKFRSKQQEKASFQSIIQKIKTHQVEGQFKGENNFYSCKLYLKIIKEVDKRNIPQLSSIIISKMLQLCQKICQQTVFDKKLRIKVNPLQKINNMSKIIEGLCQLKPHKCSWKKQFPAFFYIFQRLLKKQLQDQSLYPAEYWQCSAFSILAVRQANSQQAYMLEDQKMRMMCKYCPMSDNYYSLKAVIEYFEQRMINFVFSQDWSQNKLQIITSQYPDSHFLQKVTFFDENKIFETFEIIKNTNRCSLYFEKHQFIVSFCRICIYRQKIFTFMELLNQLGLFCSRVGGKRNIKIFCSLSSWFLSFVLRKQTFLKIYFAINQRYSLSHVISNKNPELFTILISCILKMNKLNPHLIHSYFTITDLNHMACAYSKMHPYTQQFITLSYYKVILLLYSHVQNTRKQMFLSNKIMRSCSNKGLNHFERQIVFKEMIKKIQSDKLGQRYKKSQFSKVLQQKLMRLKKINQRQISEKQKQKISIQTILQYSQFDIARIKKSLGF